MTGNMRRSGEIFRISYATTALNFETSSSLGTGGGQVKFSEDPIQLQHLTLKQAHDWEQEEVR